MATGNPVCHGEMCIGTHERGATTCVVGMQIGQALTSSVASIHSLYTSIGAVSAFVRQENFWPQILHSRFAWPSAL